MCAGARLFAGKPAASCRDIEWNWLGTDDQGRDVVARLIYGFRISVLFGLLLAGISSVVGIAAGAIQGYFGGWTDLLFQRLIEIWSSLPQLYLLIILSAIIAPASLCCSSSCCRFPGSTSSISCAPNSARPQFRLCPGGAGARALQRKIMVKHVLPNAMVATLTFLPFILNSLDHDADLAGLSGLRPAARLAVARRIAAAGQINLQAPWLGLSGFTSRVMLSLLIFIGEALRDAFDPRKSSDGRAR